MSELDYARGMRWFDVPVEYPNNPKTRRIQSLRVFALDADTARREAEDDVWNRLHTDQRAPQFPIPGRDYNIGTPVARTKERRDCSGTTSWIVVASINDRGDSHGTVLFGPYPSSRVAKGDAQHWILRNQARLGYRAPVGEIVPIVRQATAYEAAHPQWMTKPENVDDPPPPPGRYAAAEPATTP